MLAQGARAQGPAPRAAAARAPANNVPPALDNGPSHVINTMIASAVAWLVVNYPGEFLSWLSRSLYGIYCNWLIGGATGFWGGVKWFFVCMKAEENVGNYFFENSKHYVGAASAAIAYWFSNRLQRFWYRASSIAQAGASIVDHEVRQKLDSIQGHLEQMAQEQQALRVSVGGVSPQVTPLRDSQGGSPSSLELQGEQRNVLRRSSRTQGKK